MKRERERETEEERDNKDSPNRTELLSNEDSVQKPRNEFAVVAGFVAGMLGGCSGIIGPICAMYFTRTTMDKTAVRSTFQLVALLQHMFNLTALSLERQVDIADTPSIAIILVAGCIGVRLGMVMHNLVSTNTAILVIRLLCIIPSCSLIGGDNAALTGYLMLGVLVMAVIVVAACSLEGRYRVFTLPVPHSSTS